MHTHLISHPLVATASSEREENLDTLLSSELFTSTKCVKIQQVHQANCAVIDQTYHPDQIIEADAVITTLPQTVLAVRHADCLPILIFHPRGLVAAIHAGRKGTQAQITKKTLRTIKKSFGITDDLHLWFGPALCKDCHTYRNYSAHFDLYSENMQQVWTVFPQESVTITMSDSCTAHRGSNFYSYRADGAGVPMNWSVIGLRE